MYVDIYYVFFVCTQILFITNERSFISFLSLRMLFSFGWWFDTYYPIYIYMYIYIRIYTYNTNNYLELGTKRKQNWTWFKKLSQTFCAKIYSWFFCLNIQRFFHYRFTIFFFVFGFLSITFDYHNYGDFFWVSFRIRIRIRLFSFAFGISF